jgi:DNA-binding MarR family transcriptional regulator
LYDAPRTFKELLVFRKVAPPTLSRTIEAMVQRGWVERVPHPTDRRQVLLSLTTAGKSEVETMVERVESHLAQYVERASPQERQSLTTALDILNHMFQGIQCPPDAATKPAKATKAAKQRNNATRAPKQRRKA